MRGLDQHSCCMAPDRFEHNIRVVKKRLISESKDAKASVGEAGVSQAVAGILETMDPAVEFDDQLELGAEEINDGA
jgi:hypothetical protein